MQPISELCDKNISLKERLPPLSKRNKQKIEENIIVTLYQDDFITEKRRPEDILSGIKYLMDISSQGKPLRFKYPLWDKISTTELLTRAQN